MKKHNKQTICSIRNYYLLFGIIALLLFIYIISPSFIEHIVKIIVSFIDIKIIKTFPLNNQSEVDLHTELNVLFNVPIRNSYINIDSAMLYKNNSSKNLINNIIEEKNKAQFNSTEDLERFSDYNMIVKYTTKDIFNKNNTKIKKWSFITSSGQIPPSERPCSKIYKPNTINNKEILGYYVITILEKPCKPSYNKSKEIVNTTTSIINGSADADRMYGSKKNDIIYGNIGNDTIYGSDGDDKIYGGLNDDYLSGRNGNDHIYAGVKESTQSTNSITIDEVRAGSGNDEIVSDGYDLIDCGSGVDSVNYINTTKYLNCENLIR